MEMSDHSNKQNPKNCLDDKTLLQLSTLNSTHCIQPKASRPQHTHHMLCTENQRAYHIMPSPNPTKMTQKIRKKTQNQDP